MKTNSVKRLKLTAMAYDRKFAKNKIQELGDQVHTHAFKIMLFPTSTYTRGWEKEILTWFNRMRVFSSKIKGKKLVWEDIYKFLLEELHRSGSTQKTMEFVIQVNDELKPRSISEDQAEVRMDFFYKEFSMAVIEENIGKVSQGFQILKH